ncbi:MAG TPA: class I SAM-dependent methyltransferase [Candidatus Binatia bacterium]|jgi:caffeoyl-CoA O-methyltransferase|nr:class I SAM-dependent methyltransferase [Candidatus Binatia bacterium]
MGTKYLTLNERQYSYLCACRSDAADPVLAELRAETFALGKVSECQISDEQGAFLNILVAALGARTAIEVGTFTGYSSLCIARALPPQGRLICVDQNQEWTAIARRYWSRAGLQDRIDLRLGPAVPTLQKLEPGLTFDFVFIDADKTEYDAYYELLLPRVRPNGLILFDNMLWHGQLGGDPIQDPNGRAIDALNHKLARDSRIETVLLPVADGIQFCRKR